MSQYIPDLTERFPEGFGGVDLTDSYFPSRKPWYGEVQMDSCYDDFMEIPYEFEEEQQIARQQSPCCENCNNCYFEYGEDLCKIHDYPLDDMKEKCKDWI